MIEWLEFNGLALLEAIGLFCLFASFHTICAQISFKELLAKITSDFFVEYFWRIIYVYISLKLYFGIAMPFIYEHIPQQQLFSFDQHTQTAIGYISQVGYWCFVLVLVQIDFLYYSGIKQMVRGIFLMLRIIKNKNVEITYNLKTNYFYSIVRHPLYFALLMMLLPGINSMGGLIVYILIILYLMIGLPIEERKLVKQFGQQYVDYQKRTPMFIPLMKLAMWKRWFKNA